jgi:starch phosphorylase
MKVLVNGGLNCSILDGWWDEVYQEDVGWSIGDGKGGEAAEVDARDLASLYDTLEQKIVPEFYDRDATGLPRAWVGRIRRSMSLLTPQFASTNMVREYVEKAYLPMAKVQRARWADGCALAKAMSEWSGTLQRRWSSLHVGEPIVVAADGRWRFSVHVFGGDLPLASVRVELFADERQKASAEVIVLHQEHAIPGTTNGYIYAGEVEAARPAQDYTVRIVPYHPAAQIPMELPLITWQR